MAGDYKPAYEVSGNFYDQAAFSNSDLEKELYNLLEELTSKETDKEKEGNFNPVYEELKQPFTSNLFNASSCRCKPGRC